MTQVIQPLSPDAPERRSILASLLAVRELPIVVALILVVVIASIRQHDFLSRDSFRSLLPAISVVMVLAMGEAVVVITRGIDVSIGSIMAVAGMTVAQLFRDHRIESMAAGVTIALLLGAALGAFNGLLVAAARVPPVIATLGTLGAYRALVFIMSHGATVSDNELPDALKMWALSGPFGETTIPTLVLIALLAAGITFVLLRYSRFGRHAYAVGGNTDAARLRGVPVRRVTFLAYVYSGLMAGIAGLMYAARSGSISPDQIGAGAELGAIAAVAIGGVSIFGGAGGVAGVVLGCLLLGTIEVALTVLRIQPGWQMTAYGAAILASISLDVWLGRHGRRA